MIRVVPTEMMRAAGFGPRGHSASALDWYLLRPRRLKPAAGRGSVLVLVMTLLGILFVLGVALLASMNFEAGMIAAESSRSASQTGVANVTDNATAVLRDTMMFSPEAPFGGPAVPSSSAFADFQPSYAEMPGVHNTFGPIEPYRDDNSTAILTDDSILYPWFTDLVGLKRVPFSGPVVPWAFSAIDTRMFSGQIGIDADLDGVPETPVVDADGDGIVDSVQVDASLLGLSEAQLAELSAQLNPPGDPGGKVYVALRIIPHTGLVNLNASHPNLIRTVFDMPFFPPNGAAPDPNLGNFVHRPTQLQVAYPPFQDEAALRRRALLAPRVISPSWLHGNPLVDLARDPSGRSDMAWYIYPPADPAASVFESVFNHRHAAFEPDEPFDPRNPDSPPIWAMRMEPATSDMFDDNPNDGVTPQLDRRHLVTTISHEGLLAPPAHVTNSVLGTSEDLLAKMRQVNQVAYDPNVCPPLLPNGLQGLPFEYADYPHTVQDDCHQDLFDSDAFCHCPTCVDCTPNVRKGRMQLSLPWLDEVYRPDKTEVGGAYNDYLPRPRRDRLIYDAFLMLLSNAAGPYWQDVDPQDGSPVGRHVDCTLVDDCPDFEYCAIPTGTTGVCRDLVTNQRHRVNVITRTAAALTANMIDYADLECAGGSRDQLPCVEDADCPSGTCADLGIPTRVALRSFDFEQGVCTKGARTGMACSADNDCTGGGNNSCRTPQRTAGVEFDFDATGGPSNVRPEYVYGLERQPFITEVATMAQGGLGSAQIVALAIEIFNPYGTPINTQGQYVLRERSPNGTLNDIPLVAPVDAYSGPNSTPFTVFAAGGPGDIPNLVGPMAHGKSQYFGPNQIQFRQDWTIYLVRRYQFPGDNAPTEIVVDQFEVRGGKVGLEQVELTEDCQVPENCRFSLQRVVSQASVWTAPVPLTIPADLAAVTLGDWNGVAEPSLHPVELQFANLGTFSRPFRNPNNASDPRNGSIAFPTTGSLLMVLRHANRSWTDQVYFTDPNRPPSLAFTARLNDRTEVFDTSSNIPQSLGTVFERDLIDNGRAPVFERPQLDSLNNYTVSAHFVSPRSTAPAAPSGKDTLPWGQLVFDYFTALPLSNAGPYFVDTNVITPADAGAQPRVDLEGLRVQGRINLNAAPWKVLSGLPFVPVTKIPAALRDQIRAALPGDPATGATYASLFTDDEAGTIGEALAQAIVAYRELRPLPSGTANWTGNYGDGTPPGPPPGNVAYARGWAATNPLARRGTGFASVGELANIRHSGALQVATPPPPGYPRSYHRIDAGFIDENEANNNTENFVQAAAALIALGDWVTVRSEVFTVYGVLRGEEDFSIVDPNPSLPPTVEQLRARDVDSRALRFQETIDRLPTVLGEPAPTRIGPRSVSKYSDARND